jgi:hypothetical protein
MSKSITNQRLIYKIHSNRFKYAKWNLNIDLQEAIKNEEIVSLGDSIVLRMIRQIRDNKIKEKDIRETKEKIKKIKIENKDYSEQQQILEQQILEEDYLLIIFDNIEDWNYANSKKEDEVVKFNGKIFKRLLGTNGGIKKNVVVFVNEEIHSELNKRLNNGRNTKKKYVPAKFESYKALPCSCSTPVTQPERILVIQDGQTKFTEKVLKLIGKPSVFEERINKKGEKYKKEIVSNEFDLIEDENYEVEKQFTDGCGMISPKLAEQWTIDMGEYKLDESENKIAKYISSGFNIRNSWTKGMVFTFPFMEYADELKRYEVIDAWGDKRDIRNVDLIITTNMLKLWDAYDNLEHYMSCCKENGFEFCVAKILPNKLENTRNMNYQFLQSYELSDEDIDKLIEPTVTTISGAIGSNNYDYGKMLLFLKGNKITEEDFEKEEYDYIKALMINEKMMQDPFIKQKIHKMIKKRIDDSKKGVIQIKGNYSIISGDLYALCQYMFGEKVTGILKANEFYAKTWLNEGVNKIVAYRAPMTIHNNIKIMNLVKNGMTEKWYRYMKVVTVFNAWDTTSDAMNGADWDGDAIITTDNKVLINNTKNLLTVMCEQKTSKKMRISETQLIKANKNGFGNDVGSITNRCTAMFDILAKFKKGTKEYNDMLYRVTCMQGYQQEIIDSCKGIIPKKVPKEWYDYKSVKINKEDDDKVKNDKIYNQLLLSNKKPYFFIYNYKHVKTKYEQYTNNNNNNCIIKFGKTLKELIDSDYRTEEENEFLKYYHALIPVSNNNSTVNRICHRLEGELDKLKIIIKKTDFDKTILVTDKKVKPSIKEKLKELYEEYKKDVYNSMKGNKIKKIDKDEKKNTRLLFMTKFKNKADEICKSDKEVLCNGLVELLYDNINSKQFVWDICGEYIVDKLLKDNENTINYPVLNYNGDIEWCGNKYEMINKRIGDDTVC